VDNLPQDQKEDVRSRANAINERIMKVKEAATLVEGEESCNDLIKQVNGIKQEQEDLLNYVQQKIADNEKAIRETE
jgi:vacuolar-type H+-ATPase subunit I/STV1